MLSVFLRMRNATGRSMTYIQVGALAPIIVIHNVQGCPRFARINLLGVAHIFCGTPTKQKKVKRNRARLQPQIKNGYVQ